MAETIEPTNELTAIQICPEFYVRINLSKTAAGWRHETTVSMRWSDDAIGDEASRTAIRGLLIGSDQEARTEIARREALDAEKVATP